jgi:hypothetical protein
MIKSRIKIYQLNENGYLLLCGIDSNSKEIFYCLEPKIPINSFYYECSRKFNFNIIDDLFKEKNIGNIIFISGEECIIYEYIGYWRKIKSLNANLIKRHSKGGQSSIRFARLAEESRLHYITYCIDYINDLCCQSNSYIYGGTELKLKLLEHQLLKIKLKTENKYHEFNNSTIYDKYFENLINSENSFQNDIIIQQIITHLELNPDILLFTEEEINENSDNIEYILIIDKNLINKYSNKKNIQLTIGSKYYYKLKDFIIIGKKYY